MRRFAISLPAADPPSIPRQECWPVAKKVKKKSSRRKPTRRSAEERLLDLGEQGSEVERALDERLKKQGWWFDQPEAERICHFFETYIRHSKGEWAGQTIKLQDWQKRYLRRKFGWRRPNGTRRYRRSVMFLPKKNGKSLMAAGEELYHLTADGEPGAQVYSCAANKDQAGEVFEEAKKMVGASPELSNLLEVYAGSIFFQRTQSRLQSISSKAATKHGFNVHASIFDEVHAFATSELYDVVSAGAGARRQPMETVISTAGNNIASFGFELFDMAVKLRDGILEDPECLAIVYAADPDADWRSEEVWRAANPNFGVSVNPDFLRGELAKTRMRPAHEPVFRQLYLNIWSQAAKAWLPIEKWRACKSGNISIEALRGRPCWGALDLSRSIDMSAFVLIFPLEDGEYASLEWFWCPEARVQERSRTDKAQYASWIQQGSLLATEGDVIDYRFIRQKIKELGKVFKIQEIAYDRKYATEIVQNLQDLDGFTMVDVGQGMLSMSGPTKELERLLYARQFHHAGNPVTTWMASNVVVKMDEAENIKPDKKKSTDRIDGIVAMIMALGRATLREGDSVYKKRGLIVL